MAKYKFDLLEIYGPDNDNIHIQMEEDNNGQ